MIAATILLILNKFFVRGESERASDATHSLQNRLLVG